MHLAAFSTALLVVAPLFAQPSTAPRMPALSNFASSPEILALVARAKRKIKPDQPLVQLPLLRLAPYTAFMEYRRGAWSAAYHPDIEIVYVVEGSGTIIIGGSLVGEKPGADGNRSGTDITGGVARKVSTGDFFMVPKQTPHMFPKPDGDLVLITMHVPSP